jgi:hypothetical protein
MYLIQECKIFVKKTYKKLEEVKQGLNKWRATPWSQIGKQYIIIAMCEILVKRK